MEPARRAFSEGLLREHFEELGFLWELRTGQMRSPQATVGGLRELDLRIKARLNALRHGGSLAVDLAISAVVDADPGTAFAAASALLPLRNDPRRKWVLASLIRAGGDAAGALGDAWCHWGRTEDWEGLRRLLLSGERPLAAAVAALILASEGALRPADLQAASPLFLCEEPGVRRTVWHAMAVNASGMDAPQPRAEPTIEQLEAGVADEDPDVRAEAMSAAAWSRQQWLPSYLRGLPSGGDMGLEALHILAVLGDPLDLPRILDAGRDPSLGADRFKVLSSFGHSDVVEVILEGVESSVPAVAVAAATAFTLVTGVDIESDERVSLVDPAGEPLSDFEEEFQDEGFLPDADRARTCWEDSAERFASGGWWRRGIDLTNSALPQALDQLDCEGRWNVCQRLHSQGSRMGLSLNELKRLTFTTPGT